MHVLVTGSAGFVGKELVKALSSSGYQVSEFDIFDGDISQTGTLDKFLRAGINHVIHLAGKVFIPDSWKDPYSFYLINFMGTANVLEFCRKSGAGITFISSNVYGYPRYLPVDENHILQPNNPYTHSKVVAEHLCTFYRDEFKIPVTIFRPFNIFGPGQQPPFLIPEIINAAVNKNEKVIKVRDLKPKRDYIFIDDFISALILSVKGPKDIYNIGSGRSFSVEEVIQCVLEITNSLKGFSSEGIERNNEISDIYANIEKAKVALGWNPKYSFSEGISKCVEFVMLNNK
ncbi:MAG: NAD(P)-dependent oxidoreductase [Bacteroidetes bacterium]|nr:NAD(P)-dependent oxidoreductase [Bacteroidota bacterium]